MAVFSSAYEFQPSFVLGFHGCDQSTGEAILRGQVSHLKQSEKRFDWLGHGIYFWEGNPSRAMDWALGKQAAGEVTSPFVLGAIIDLRHCLDLFDRDGLLQVKTAHSELRDTIRITGAQMPKNVGSTPDKSGRALDCAVMNYLHKYRETRSATKYDSVRAPFLEGKKLFPYAGFRSENHIQLCVRNSDCIKGYFRPLIEAQSTAN